MARKRVLPSPFRYFNSSPEVIRLVVMMYVKDALSLRNVEDLLAERGIDLSTRGCASGGTGSTRCSPPSPSDGESGPCSASGG